MQFYALISFVNYFSISIHYKKFIKKRLLFQNWFEIEYMRSIFRI